MFLGWLEEAGEVSCGIRIRETCKEARDAVDYEELFLPPAETITDSRLFNLGGTFFPGTMSLKALAGYLKGKVDDFFAKQFRAVEAREAGESAGASSGSQPPAKLPALIDKSSEDKLQQCAPLVLKRKRNPCIYDPIQFTIPPELEATEENPLTIRTPWPEPSPPVPPATPPNASLTQREKNRIYKTIAYHLQLALSHVNGEEPSERSMRIDAVEALFTGVAMKFHRRDAFILSIKKCIEAGEKVLRDNVKGEDGAGIIVLNAYDGIGSISIPTHE